MKSEIHNHNNEEMPFMRLVVSERVEGTIIKDIELVATGATSKEALANMKELIGLSKEVKHD